MQRVILVYNPKSSKQARIQTEVIDKLQSMSGIQIGKFTVKTAPVEENAKNLARILMDKDLVIVAGGDGSATVGVNAAMMTDKDVALGILGYGNFNDMARMLGESDCEEIVADYAAGKVQDLYPLEAYADGKFYKYAACYFTIGMFAESTEEFNAKDTRDNLKKGKKGMFYSIRRLARWYFKNKKHTFLPPDIHMDDEPMGNNVSDVMFINSRTVAKMMKGGEYWRQPTVYRLSYGRLKSFFRLICFMSRSILHRIPGEEVSNATKITFLNPAKVEIQAEGEYEKREIYEFSVRKSHKPIKVVVR